MQLTVQHRLFVYGTLAPGQPNEHILWDLAGEWQPGTVRGLLREAGWGADIGYPGIELDAKGDHVPGLLFSSAELPQHWARLDEFEGEEYLRVETDVTLPDGSRCKAFIYRIR